MKVIGIAVLSDMSYDIMENGEWQRRLFMPTKKEVEDAGFQSVQQDPAPK